MKIDKYDLFFMDSYKQDDIAKLQIEEYDLYISAYNEELMVLEVFNAINAKNKIWLIFPDYKYKNAEALNSLTHTVLNYTNIPTDLDDLEKCIIDQFIKDTNLINEYKNKKICIDITGFVKPYMIYLMLYLKNYNFPTFDILYSEPKIYLNREETTFSEEEVIKTRTINGFDLRTDEGADDLFIINAGYDHKLIRSVGSWKIPVEKQKILIGFPSLQPIMFQENILNLHLAADELEIHANNFNPLLAPANDPFETAKVIKDYVDNYISKKDNIQNIYLAPIGTKPQALGIFLFCMFEEERLGKININLKMIYPFTKSYSTSAGKELFKVNKYTLEFP